jgi:hypothetical protein
MRTRRLAADREPRGCIERLRARRHQPRRSILAVIRARGIRMLRCEPILDADHDEPGRLCEREQRWILRVRRAERPATAVNVEIDALRFTRRSDHAHRNLARAPRDRNLLRLRNDNKRPERPLALFARRANQRGSDLVDRRSEREQLLEALVKRDRLGRHRFGNRFEPTRHGSNRTRLVR